MPTRPVDLSASLLESFVTFGDVLKYLRRRARLTQSELAIAVGYSREQITKLENNQRLPDVTAIKALFVPALDLDERPDLIERFLQLAAAARAAKAEECDEADTLPAPPRALRTNLRQPLTSFVGRDRELQQLLVAQIVGQYGVERTRGGGGGGDAECQSDAVGHKGRVGERSQLYEPHAVSKILLKCGSDLERQACFAHAPWASQSEQARGVQQTPDLSHLALTPHEVGERRVQIGS